MGIRPWIEEESPTRQLVHEPGRFKSPPKHSMWQHVSQKLQQFLGSHEPCNIALPASPPPECDADQRPPPLGRGGSPSCSPKRVDVRLPRMGTFRRQNSERRDRLEPVDQSSRERRANSATRQNILNAIRPQLSRSLPPPPLPPQDEHGPEPVPNPMESNAFSSGPQAGSDFSRSAEPNTPTSLVDDFDHEYAEFPMSRSRSSSAPSFERLRNGDARTQLEAELDSKWILNLSMHFRDKSDREKFFVTYAETPTRWRRVTVSCDYRDAEPGSLEMDLKELPYQRDKSIQIYESIRDSLPEIQFYNTVTNLKLETSEGRLHVHVTEDINEIIPYPPTTSVEHILNDEEYRPMEIRESELAFDSHISGFVYKVRYGGKDYIKKEIPGPDTVDEFLYEINALHALTGSDSVIQLEAIIVDDQRETVKGLLISFAEQGALVDLLYDHKGEISWEDRVRWAQQAVQGLSEIHEEGYVQGDFTLSNIVVDGENNAKIIDINRRGCPVGWEPPEIAKKIQSNQRISMYIGEKSDLYQLGMTLWALAMDDDEPERHDLPLSTEDFPLHVPRWYSRVVDICLKEKPRQRLSAKELLRLFPVPSTAPTRPTLHGRSSTARATDKRYIEPSAAVEREDIERLGFSRPRHTEDDFTSHDSTVDPVFTEARSSSYQFDGGSSYVGVTRGRRPATNMAHLETSHPRHQDSGLGDIDLPENCDLEPQIIPVSPAFDREYDEIELDGIPYLVSRQSFDPEELDILNGHGRGRRRSVQNILSRLEPVVQETAEPHPANPNDHETKAEEDIELQPDQVQAEQHPLGESSITSGSTPRNSSSTMASLGTHPAPFQPLDLVTADLAGLGGHPSLDEHSPQEPKSSPTLQLLSEGQVVEEPTAIPTPDSSHTYEESTSVVQGIPVYDPPNISNFGNSVSGDIESQTLSGTLDQNDPISQDMTNTSPPIEQSGVSGESDDVLDTATAVLEQPKPQNTLAIRHDNDIDNGTVTADTGDQPTASPATEASIYHDVPMTHSNIPAPLDQQATEEIETQPQLEP